MYLNNCYLCKKFEISLFRHDFMSYDVLSNSLIIVAKRARKTLILRDL